MRNFILVAITALLAFFVIQGCEKDRLPVASAQVKAAKAEVEVGQTDTLYFSGANGDESVQWTVTPQGFSSLTTKGNTAGITFTKDGIYTVAAQTAKAAAASIAIKVTALPDTSTIVPISGDVSIALSYSRNVKRDSIKMNFSMVTTNTFCPGGKLQYNTAIDSIGKTYKLDLLNIKEPKVCPGTPDVTLSASDIFTHPVWFGLDTYQLKVTLNGVTYTGTLVVSSSNIVITWNYTSGVLIPVKVISG